MSLFLADQPEQSEYAALLPTKNPAKTKKAREALGKSKPKTDVLQREQLAPWFSAVQQLQNPVIASCLQFLLLSFNSLRMEGRSVHSLSRSASPALIPCTRTSREGEGERLDASEVLRSFFS